LCEKTNGDLVNCFCWEDGVRGFDSKMYCEPIKYSAVNPVLLNATVVKSTKHSFKWDELKCGSSGLDVDENCEDKEFTSLFGLSSVGFIPIGDTFPDGWPWYVASGSSYYSYYDNDGVLSNAEVCINLSEGATHGFTTESVNIYKIESSTSTYTVTEGNTTKTCVVTTRTPVLDHVEVWLKCNGEKVKQDKSFYCPVSDSCSDKPCETDLQTYVSGAHIENYDAVHHYKVISDTYSFKKCHYTIDTGSTTLNLTVATNPQTSTHAMTQWCCEAVEGDYFKGCHVGDIPQQLCNEIITEVNDDGSTTGVGHVFSFSSTHVIKGVLDEDDGTRFERAVDCTDHSDETLCTLDESMDEGDTFSCSQCDPVWGTYDCTAYGDSELSQK